MAGSAGQQSTYIKGTKSLTKTKDSFERYQLINE